MPNRNSSSKVIFCLTVFTGHTSQFCYCYATSFKFSFTFEQSLMPSLHLKELRLMILISSQLCYSKINFWREKLWLWGSLIWYENFYLIGWFYVINHSPYISISFSYVSIFQGYTLALSYPSVGTRQQWIKLLAVLWITSIRKNKARSRKSYPDFCAVLIFWSYSDFFLHSWCSLLHI